MDATSRRGPGVRLLLVLPAGAILLLGLNGGIQLLGLPAPLPSERLPDLHAPLLVFGFVGTLISLERAVALRAAAAYAAPALLAGGALLTLLPVPATVGRAVLAAGMLLHVGQYAALWRRQETTAIAVQALGAVSAAAAAVAWLGGVGPPRLVPLFAVFLILTIAGERLELSRVTAPGARAERVLFSLAAALVVCAALTLTVPTVVIALAGLAVLGIVVWLLRYDIARVTVRRHGLPRYVASCLLAGYGWLALAGVGWILGGARTEGPLYDATTHAVFLGFAMTMIMAHAPLILPAVLRVAIPFHVVLYAPVGLLHAALLVRVVAGDAWGSTAALRAGGVGGAVAILLFAVTAGILSWSSRRRTLRGSAADVAS